MVQGIGALAPGRPWAYVWAVNPVYVTTDAGAHWLVTVFGGGVKSADVSGGVLRVRALGPQEPGGKASETFRYVSPDHGRTWFLRGRLPDVPG